MLVSVMSFSQSPLRVCGVDVGKNADRQLCFQTTLSSSQHTVNDLEAAIVRSIHFLAVSNILWIKPLYRNFRL